MALKRVTFDSETRSKSDLKREGAYKYSLHSSTQPTCLAVKARGGPLMFLPFQVVNRPWKKLPLEFRREWKRFIAEGYEFSAHNAFFERAIYVNILVARYGWPEIPLDKWRCTAAKAAACALPRNLEGAGESMNLTIQKDKMGYVAMMATCKPTRQWNAWMKACADQKAGVRIGARKLAVIARGEPKMFLDYEDNPQIWDTLYHYCKIDVRAEEKLDESLPDLIPDEQEIWHLNQKLNWRGLRVDIPLVKKIVAMMSVESKNKLEELDSLTLGLVTKPGARKSILEFLALDDIIIPDIRAKTVSDLLDGDKLTGDMRRLLEIRQALSKTSTRKYQTFIDRAGVDHRVRDILLYHGASTGRDTGTGVQPHNFPRGVIDIDKSDPYGPVNDVVQYGRPVLELLYSETLGMLFSSILRNMLLPSEGCELFVADFSKIEVAVLWWLSGNLAGLKILNSGKDPYIFMAAANTGKTYAEVEKAVEANEQWAVDARQLGKAQVLGCGFGMGWRKFRKTAWEQYRLKLTAGQSREAVKTYREANDAVTDVWEEYEQAAVVAIQNPNRIVRAGKCKFVKSRGFLWVELPSGRRLAYRAPRVVWRSREYEQVILDKHGEPKLDKDGLEITKVCYTEPLETIEFLGLDKSKKRLGIERTWGGTLTENIVQAVARDLMMPAMVRLEKAGYAALLSVHDEALTEKLKGKGDLKEFLKILLERPKWADKHLPLDAKGWVGPRYRK